METLTPWITPTLVIALFVWLRSEFNTRFSTIEKRFENVDRRFDEAARDNAKRFENINRRFDEVARDNADLRERMAKLEGSLDGFLAGRRDPHAA